LPLKTVVFLYIFAAPPDRKFAAAVFIKKSVTQPKHIEPRASIAKKAIRGEGGYPDDKIAAQERAHRRFVHRRPRF
jgi:hypothetical protein